MCNSGNVVRHGKARSAVMAGRAAPSRSRPVWLEYHSEHAREVRIAGSFNHWNPEITGMVRVKRNRWLRALFLPPGRYEYVFVVDGVCVADPNATETVPNVYGCVNSVFSVPSAPPRNARRRDLTNIPEFGSHGDCQSNRQKTKRKRKMKRTLLNSLAVLAIVLAALALTGCSSSSDGGGSGDHQHMSGM